MGRVSGLFNRAFEAYEKAEMPLWLTATLSLTLGVIVSGVVILTIKNSNSMEEKARLLRMCRENPQHAPKRCAAFFKTRRGPVAKSGFSSAKDSLFGFTSWFSKGDGNYKGQNTQLSHITQNQAFSMSEEDVQDR
jgi:hypothetical protein